MNGTYIADLAYEAEPYSRRYVKVGAVLYFRSHDCKVKVTKNPPIGRNIIGKFLTSQKVPDAPLIEGDLFVKKEKVGHIHSQQNAIGETLYWLRLNTEVEPPAWLKVELE